MIASSVLNEFVIDGIPVVSESRVSYRLGESDLRPRTVTVIAKVERISLEFRPLTLADVNRSLELMQKAID